MTPDERLRRLEIQLSNLYKDAQDEMREKWDGYLNRQKERVAKALQRIQEAQTDGEKKVATEKYVSLMKSLTAGNQHYRSMVRELAKQYTEVNERALKIINGERPEFYAAGYNLSADEINTVAIAQNIGIRFDLCSAEAVEWLMERIVDYPDVVTMPPPERIKIPEDERWNAKMINAQMAQGIAQGESIPKIAARISNVTDGDLKASVRRARTMATGCQNAGRVQSMKVAESWGVQTKKEWVCTHDDRTRDTHSLLDGEKIGVDDIFWNGCRYPGDHLGPPQEVWNCFVGETKIAADCEIVRSYKHEYSGNLITVKTAGGVKFSCTPNHPILTPGGWVAAESLNRGDNLLIASICDDGAARIEPDVNHAFPRIDAIHEFFDELGGERTCALGVNFHGDVATSEVEIISKEGFLRDNRNTSTLKCDDEFRFKNSGALVFAEGHLVSRFGRVRITALHFMRGRYKTLTLFGRRLGHAVIHGFGAVSRGDSAVFQAETDSVPRDVQFISEGFDGLPGKVLRDNIIDIKITTVSHIPVYNLQTENGYYFVNDIIPQNWRKVNGNFAIAHNCRCTLITVVDGFSSNLPKGKEAAVHVWFDGEKVK